MADFYDFNAVRRPGFCFKLRDAEQTVITVNTPDVSTYSKALTFTRNFKDMLKQDGEQALSDYCGIVADLMSNNQEGLTITADDLGERYRLDFADLAAFMQIYFDFIDKIQNAKN